MAAHAAASLLNESRRGAVKNYAPLRDTDMKILSTLLDEEEKNDCLDRDFTNYRNIFVLFIRGLLDDISSIYTFHYALH